MNRGVWQTTVHRVTKSRDTTEVTWKAHKHTSKSRFFPGTPTVTAILEGCQE